jgi:hypothetical protein
MQMKTLVRFGLSLALGLGATAAMAAACPQTSVNWATTVCCTKFGRNGCSVGSTDASGNLWLQTYGDNPAGCAWRGDGLNSSGASVCSIVTYGQTSSSQCPAGTPGGAVKTKINFTQQSGVAGGSC